MRRFKRRVSKFTSSVVTFINRPFKALRPRNRTGRFSRLPKKTMAWLNSTTKSVLKFEGTGYSFERSDGQVLLREWPSWKNFVNPIWWFAWTWKFVLNWFRTRPYNGLILAIPSIVLLVVFASGLLVASNLSRSRESVQYRRLLAQSIETKNFELARLSADALVRMYPGSLEEAYNRAQVEYLAGKPANARTMMEDLALSGRSFQAAMWLANSVGDRLKFSEWTKEQKEDYYRWLNTAALISPADPIPKRALGDLFRALGDNRSAYANLLPIAETDSETELIVVFLEKELGLVEEAKRRAKKLVAQLEPKIAKQAQDSTLRSHLASLYVLLGRENDAVGLLQDGLRLATKSEEISELKRSLTEALVLDSQRIARSDKTPRGMIRRFDRLREAVAIDPTNALLLEVVTQTSIELADTSVPELIVLREAIVQGVAPDTSHFILGTVLLIKGNVSEAQSHLEIALKNNPNLPGLLNNLAHAVANQENPDLERALRLANAAVDGLPNHPYLRETRGQILFKLGKYQECIADLEAALAAVELRPVVRESLAKAYDEVGLKDIADRHRELLAKEKLK